MRFPFPVFPITTAHNPQPRRAASILVAAAAFAGSPGVIAGDDVDQSRDVPGDSYVEVVNVRGNIDIAGWDRDVVRVSGELDDLAEGLVFEVSDKRVLIEVKLPHRDVNWGDGSNLEIRVPTSARVDFRGVSTDLDASSLEGGLRVRSVSGDVRAKDLAGQVIISTVSGEIRAGDITGECRLKTISGEIDLDCDCRTVDVDTVSGDIDVDLQKFTSLRATAVNGDVEIRGQLVDAGEIDMNSVNGDLAVVLARPVDAFVSAETGPGGDISNRMTGDKPVKRFPASMALETVSGDGNGRIKMRTVNGDISLRND